MDTRRMGGRLLLRLEELGWSRGELARRLGVTPQRVGQIISGGAKKIELWNRIAEVTEVPLSYYLNDQPPRESVTVGSVQIIGTPEQLAALVPHLQDPMSLTRPPSTGEPWPGVVELLADTSLCETLGITPELREVLSRDLSALPIGPATKAEALAVAQTLKLVTGRR